MVVDAAVLPPFVPWTPARLKYPNAGWQDGIDYKLVEADPVNGNVTSQLRLKPGKRTPNIRIRGNTHFYVLAGSVTLAPSGGGRPVVLSPNTYVYIPDGYAFTLANPRSTLVGAQ
jgi:mannose-6-phosphate isomerase-like protein (cupin superfamily)